MIKIKDFIFKLIRPFARVLNQWILSRYYQSTKEINSVESSKKVLIFAPHMDDETIGLGGTIKKHSLAKCEIHCVFITDGAKSASNLPGETLSRIRKEEVNRVAKILGINHLYFMDFPDGQVSNMLDEQTKISHYLQEIKPDIIYLPPFIDAHPDHIATAHLVAEAVERDKLQNLIIRLYEINCAFPPKYINCVFDISDVNAEKIKAIEQFKSQAIHFEGFIKLSQLKTNLLQDKRQAKNVESFIQLSPKQFIAHKNVMKDPFNKYHEKFKQVNREETLLWAIYKSNKLKNSLYENSLKL